MIHPEHIVDGFRVPMYTGIQSGILIDWDTSNPGTNTNFSTFDFSTGQFGPSWIGPANSPINGWPVLQLRPFTCPGAPAGAMLSLEPILAYSGGTVTLEEVMYTPNELTVTPRVLDAIRLVQSNYNEAWSRGYLDLQGQKLYLILQHFAAIPSDGDTDPTDCAVRVYDIICG
jgi:hypothetical protein